MSATLVFFNFLARSKASLMVEASFGVTSSIKHCFGIILGSSVLSGFSRIKARLKAFIASVCDHVGCSFFIRLKANSSLRQAPSSATGFGIFKILSWISSNVCSSTCAKPSSA